MKMKAGVTKAMLAFDIDHTLCPSKEPVSEEIAELLTRALGRFEICIISGRDLDSFFSRVINRLPIVDVELFRHLHCLPTQGMQYYRFKEDWEAVYAYYLSPIEVSKIFRVVEDVARRLGFWREENREKGDMILDNRASQITFAGVDTSLSSEEKRSWDPDQKKRKAMIKELNRLAPEFEYRIGGMTSIDITRPGMDKGFGMQILLNKLGIDKSEVLYFGDMTQPGGNDYPIVQMGIDTITVNEYTDTIIALKGVLGILGLLES